MIGHSIVGLQQHLPFTVLKPTSKAVIASKINRVATALTVYGIETNNAEQT